MREKLYEYFSYPMDHEQRTVVLLDGITFVLLLLLLGRRESGLLGWTLIHDFNYMSSTAWWPTTASAHSTSHTAS
jgi:hypothetical protein